MGVYDWLLWAQTAYAVWQFIREAKFFRLPFLVLFSFLTGRLSKSLPKKREIYCFLDNPEVFVEKKISHLSVPSLTNVIAELPTRDEIKVIGVDNNTVILQGHRASVLQRAMQLIEGGTFCDNKVDVLLPGLYLFNISGMLSVFNNITSGKTCWVLKVNCFVDFSPKDVLNQNFLRLLSITPLVAQARHMDALSLYLSFFIILLDINSFYANKVWKFAKGQLYRQVKLLISANVQSDSRRQFVHTFLSTISDDFMYCDTYKKRVWLTRLKTVVFKSESSVYRLKPKHLINVRLLTCDEYHITLNEAGEIAFQVNDCAYVLAYKYIYDRTNYYPDEDWLFEIRPQEQGNIIFTSSYSTPSAMNFINKILTISNKKIFLADNISESSLHVQSHLNIFQSLGRYEVLADVHKSNMLVSDYTIQKSMGYSEAVGSCCVDTQQGLFW